MKLSGIDREIQRWTGVFLRPGTCVGLIRGIGLGSVTSLTVRPRVAERLNKRHSCRLFIPLEVASREFG
jgi:hypothetical protein